MVLLNLGTRFSEKKSAQNPILRAETPHTMVFPGHWDHNNFLMCLRDFPKTRMEGTERAFDARSIMVHLDMVLGRGRLHESEEASVKV